MRFLKFKNAILVSIPAFGIGVFWALSGTIAPWIAYTYTNSATKVLALLALGPFTGIFVQYLAGIISDRTTSKWGRRTPWILVGLIVACISQILWAYAPSYAMLFVLGFITYASVNFFQGPYYTLIYEVIPKEQTGFAVFFSRFIFGIGGIAVSFFAATIWKSGGAIGSTITIALLMAVPVLLILPFTLRENKLIKKRVDSDKLVLKFDLFKHKSAAQLFFAIFFLYLATGPLSAIMTPYFVKYKGYSIETLSAALGVGGTVGLLAGLVASKFVDRFDPKRMLQGILIFDVFVFAFGSSISHSIPAFYAFAIMTGLMGMAYPIVFTLLPRVTPEGRLGEFQGLLNMFLSLGDFIMTIGNGVLIDSGHPDFVLKIEIVFVVIAFLILLPNFGYKFQKTNSLNT